MQRTITMRIGCALGIAGLAGTVTIAQAQTERLLDTYGDATFYLSSGTSRELVRFSDERDVRICIPQDEARGATQEPNIPVEVRFDGNVVTVYPGNCFEFDARQATVALPDDVDLPPDAVVSGRFRTR